MIVKDKMTERNYEYKEIGIDETLGYIMKSKRESKLANKENKIKEQEALITNWDETVRKIIKKQGNPIKRCQYIFLDMDFDYEYKIDKTLKAYIRNWCKYENFKRPQFGDYSVKIKW